MTRSLVIDRRFRGVGRICLSCDTTDRIVKKNYERMLDDLRNQGRIDILRSIRDRVITFAEAYIAWKRSSLHQLANPETAKLLSVAYAAWVRGLTADECSDKHRISLTMSGRYFKRADSKARIIDLPRLLRKLRETLGSTHPRSYNLARAAASAFLRDTFTKAHPLWRDIQAVQGRTIKRKRKGRPLSVQRMKNFFPYPPTDDVAAIAWGMATTGMGQQEYWGDWSASSGRIHIEGTKREGRVRDVPLIVAPAKPKIHRQTFEKKLRERTKRAIQPYDLRRTYVNWLERSGVPRARRKLYLGHGATDVTDLYEYHEVRQFLANDGRKVREYLELAPVKPSVILPIKRKGA